MILSEPPPSQGDIHFRLGEFPIRIHPYFWLTAILLGPIKAPPIFEIMWIPAVLISIIVHEMGHALAFGYYGIGSSIVLYGMGGLAVPTSTRRRNEPLHPTEQIVISLAGPFAGFVLGALIFAILQLTGAHEIVLSKYLVPDFTVWPPSNFAILAYCLLKINIFWGLVNLLPIYPLDGGQVSQQLFIMFYPHDPIRQSLILSIIVAIGMVVVMASRAHALDDAMFNIFLFAMLAWQNYSMLQSYSSRYPWQ